MKRAIPEREAPAETREGEAPAEPQEVEAPAEPPDGGSPAPEPSERDAEAERDAVTSLRRQARQGHDLQTLTSYVLIRRRGARQEDTDQADPGCRHQPQRR